VDALRGFALAGVALAHMTEQYIAGPAPEGFMEGVDGPLDGIVNGLIFFFVRGKFFAIFSFLFGLSFAIQMESADRRGEDFSFRFLWRAALLFLIGYVHQLFYRGDILTIYAFLVPFLIPFYKLSNKWILICAGIFFLSVPRFLAFGVLQGASVFGLPENLMESPLEKAYFEAISSGSLWDVFSWNAVYGMQFKMDFQWGGIWTTLLHLWLFFARLVGRKDQSPSKTR